MTTLKQLEAEIEHRINTAFNTTHVEKDVNNQIHPKKKDIQDESSKPPKKIC